MIRVNKIWTETDAIWIETSDGCTACEKFADYPRLKNATETQLKNFYHDEIGIHWPDLDEDLRGSSIIKTKIFCIACSWNTRN